MIRNRRILSALVLLLAALVFCEGKLGDHPWLSSSSSTDLRRLQCADFTGIVRYWTKKGEKEITCKKLARMVRRGRDISKRCHRDMIGMEADGFETGAKVRDACPVTCGGGVCDPPATASPTPEPTPAPVTAIAPTDDPEITLGDGEWGSEFDMKLIPIHSMVLPDGKILSYGTDAEGRQRADLYYEIWDVEEGAVPQEAHKLLEHYTEADIFCSSPNVDPSTGNIIIMGGDVRDPVEGVGIKTVLELDYRTHEIRPHPKGDMHFARWYGTSVNLPNGDIFVIGGRSEVMDGASAIPELWSPETGFTPLNGAEVPAIAAKPDQGHWWYPHTFVNSNGEIIVIMPETTDVDADIYRVGVEGDGSIEKIGTKPFKAHIRSASIMHRIDQVMMLDDDGGLWVADISGETPVWTKTNDIGDARINGAIAMLPDGRVAISGGSKSERDDGNDLADAVYTMQLWDPDTNSIHTGPRQNVARLYHSTSLVLPDSTVVSMGGGAPGPLNNLNGQLYVPDYFFNENQEAVVARPSILACPRNIQTGTNFVITVDGTSKVERVTATKSGANTHSRNCDTRWLDLNFEVLNDNELRVFVDFDKAENIMIAGLWMLNTIDSNGIPSVASLVGVNMVSLDP